MNLGSLESPLDGIGTLRRWRESAALAFRAEIELFEKQRDHRLGTGPAPTLDDQRQVDALHREATVLKDLALAMTRHSDSAGEPSDDPFMR